MNKYVCDEKFASSSNVESVIFILMQKVCGGGSGGEASAQSAFVSIFRSRSICKAKENIYICRHIKTY